MTNKTIVITGTSTLHVKTDYVRIKFDIDKKDLSYEKTLLLLTEQIIWGSGQITSARTPSLRLQRAVLPQREGTLQKRRLQQVIRISC